jgi:3-dehydroquinate synthase
VAAGMVLAARFSASQGHLDAPAAERLAALLARLGLPVKPPAMTPGRWLEFMARDKKNQHGRITLILLEALGRAVIVKDARAEALERFRATA